MNEFITIPIELARQPATSKYAAFKAGKYYTIQHVKTGRYWRYAYPKIGTAESIRELISEDHASTDTTTKLLDLAVNFVKSPTVIIISELTLG